jgi:hypothetical protein
MKTTTKHNVKLSSQNTITIPPFRRYAGTGTLVCVEQLDDYTCKVTLITKKELENTEEDIF